MPEDKGKVVEDMQSRESREVTLAENCYNAKNSATNRWILAHLEWEPQATFRFEGGEGQSFSSLWVVLILLGRLLHEWTALGHAIKQFSKFQQ